MQVHFWKDHVQNLNVLRNDIPNSNVWKNDVWNLNYWNDGILNSNVWMEDISNLNVGDNIWNLIFGWMAFLVLMFRVTTWGIFIFGET